MTNPSQDWNCDGQANAADQWIELRNASGNAASLFGLQVASQGEATLLNTTDRITANGYLVIFTSQIPTILLVPGQGQLELLDGAGKVLDAVNYPPLGPDLSYSRAADGQWQVTSTPTPGKANSLTSGGNPTPTPTATRRSGGNGGGSGSGAPTATLAPVGSVSLPTNTPSSGTTFQNSGDASAGGSGGSGDLAVPSWLKIALLALIGAGLLGAVIWYWRAWDPPPEEEG